MKYKIRQDLQLQHKGKTLYRVELLRDGLWGLKCGDLGGWVESEANLSQADECWIYGEAKVYDNAVVKDYARVWGEAEVFENAKITDEACVWHKANISGDIVLANNFLAGNTVQISGTHHSEFSGERNWKEMDNAKC